MGIADDDPFWIICSGCGKLYSLHMNTVCPDCYTWPKRDGSDRKYPESDTRKED